MPNLKTTADDFDAIGANPDATFAVTRKDKTVATFMVEDVMRMNAARCWIGGNGLEVRLLTRPTVGSFDVDEEDGGRR
jgi:hypothetical protein